MAFANQLQKSRLFMCSQMRTRRKCLSTVCLREGSRELMPAHTASDRTTIDADGSDLAFITVRVEDRRGNLVPEANNDITFSVEGPAEIVATDNGGPTDFTAFPSKERKAFNGLAVVIIRSKAGKKGPVTVVATGKGLEGGEVEVHTH